MLSIAGPEGSNSATCEGNGPSGSLAAVHRNVYDFWMGKSCAKPSHHISCVNEYKYFSAGVDICTWP